MITMDMTILDLIFKGFMIIIAAAAIFSGAIIIAVIVHAVRAKKNGESLPWICTILDDECINPDGDCEDCYVWTDSVLGAEKESDDGESER